MEKDCKETDYNFYKKIGICPKCKKNKPAPGRVHCFDCLETFKEQFYKHRDRYASYEKKCLERAKELRKEKKKNGICVKCKKPATHGIYCYEHSIKVKRASIRQAEKRKREREEGRKYGNDTV